MAASTPQSEGDVSRASVVIIPTVVTTMIALVLTLLRLYVRRYMIRMFGWDDFFNVLAMVAVLVVMCLVLASKYYGLGQHFDTLNPMRAAFSIKLLRITEFFLIFSTIFLKISISLFLKRLFIKSKKWKTFFWCFIAFNTITSVIDAVIIFPQCTPVEYNWNKGIKGGHCWSDMAINGTGIAQGTIAAATDFTLSILPILFLWKVQLPLRVKLGICGVMALGFASGGFALARTALVPSLTTTKDPTWDLVDLFMWAVLEATFGVIAAAAPSVRPLLGHNAITSDYSRSKSSRSKPHTLPLHSIRTGKCSRRGIGESILDTRDDLDCKDSDGDSQCNLWGQDDRGIMKTMSVEVISTTQEGPTEILETHGAPASGIAAERAEV